MYSASGKKETYTTNNHNNIVRQFGKIKCLVLGGALVAIFIFCLHASKNFVDSPKPDFNKKIDETSLLRLTAQNCPERHSLTNFKNSPPRDPELVNYFRCHHLIPPSSLPYNVINYQDSPPNIITDLFKDQKTPGFYIECGANEGDTSSHTLRLERQLKWSGLLIEANPPHFEVLKTKNRAAWLSNACLSPVRTASEMEFKPTGLADSRGNGMQGKLNLELEKGQVDPDYTDPAYFEKSITLPCFPLETMLAAINVSHVNVFYLDVQGAELKILKTLPWDDSLIIDYIQAEHLFDPEGADAMQTFVESKGYKTILKERLDLVFVRKGLL